MRRVVAREHTSLLPDKTRLAYENGFKASDAAPDAPNVLVATPTLEMGIDIGDLSAVMLAGLPRSIASYLQRVGRAGRLTGNALSLAFVTGRGDPLPKIGDPLSVINGKVRPSATYLDAKEILHRQYFAYLIDRRSAALESPPVSAHGVLSSTEPGSFLGDIVLDAESDFRVLVDSFLSTFDSLSDWAVKSLRTFAAPGSVPGSSALADVARSAVQHWTAERDLLRYRREAIEAALPELERAAEHAAATEDAKSELRAATASLGLIGRLLKNLRKEPWIAALERFGVLPNYTLLDDNVRLDVSLSWIDPDTQDFDHEAVSYDRGAAVAIGELAPGAKFYAQGLEIEVDAVDLGRDGDAVDEWVFCPSCGFASRLEEGTVTLCPRCGSTAVADTGQRMHVVELRHVSAEVRRDEATISDRRDERERVRFVLHPSADIDPAAVVTQWYVENSGFGVKYLRDLTVRWLNLGRFGVGGATRMVAGTETPAPLFRVCEECGKLDTTAGENSRREHRAWCRHRAATTEHVQTIALSRTLITQGVVLRLPAAVTRGDTLAMPSLSAAIRLGLRQVIGGDPDHLRMLEIVDPELTDGGANAGALLIHDVVPGGSGYLAALANEDRIRALLLAAWAAVENCECQNEGRAACHRCLLPFIDGNAVERLSRASAAHSLRLLLNVDDEGNAQPWTTTVVPPVMTEDPSLEPWFRELFIERAKVIGMVKELPGDWGSKVQVTLGSSRQIWLLSPQVPLGSTTPDFILDQFNGPADSIAIYTDGYRYHASNLHNRVADDAAKRRDARSMGYRVLAVTWNDLVRAGNGRTTIDAPWYDIDAARTFGPSLGLGQQGLESVLTDPLTRLMEWMQNPRDALQRWEPVASGLSLLTRLPAAVSIDDDGSPLANQAARLAGINVWTPSSNESTWALREGGCVFASHIVGGSTVIEAALVLDDSPGAAVEKKNMDAWHTWLAISNVLAFRPFEKSAAIIASSQAGPASAALPDGVESLPSHWASLLSELSDDEAVFLAAMAASESAPLPEVGMEAGDGIPIPFTWASQRVLAAEGLSPDDYAELEAAGWTVVPFDVHQLEAALSPRERR